MIKLMYVNTLLSGFNDSQTVISQISVMAQLSIQDQLKTLFCFYFMYKNTYYNNSYIHCLKNSMNLIASLAMSKYNLHQLALMICVAVNYT